MTGQPEAIGPGSRWVGWFLGALTFGSVAVLASVDVATPDPEVGLTELAAFLAFAVVGVLIVLRRPWERIGWLVAGAGTYGICQAALERIGEKVVEAGGGYEVYVYANTLFSWPLLFSVLVFWIPFLFPTGRLPSPRWRWLAWLMGTVTAVVLLTSPFQRDICYESTQEGACARAVDNPIGVSLIGPIDDSVYGAVTYGILVFGMVGALVSVVVRYRRAVEVERAQLRWYTLAIGGFLTYIIVVIIFLGVLLGVPLEELAPVDPFGFTLLLIPVSIGVAILRYRLFEIDRLISRAVSWGLVTGLLVAVYLGIVFSLRTLLPVEGEFPVAVSTLAVAALFTPLRRRIQAVVDRRFNRSKYDAQHEVERFGDRLREQITVSDLASALRSTVGTVVEPARLSLWVKGR